MLTVVGNVNGFGTIAVTTAVYCIVTATVGVGREATVTGDIALSLCDNFGFGFSCLVIKLNCCHSSCSHGAIH